MYDQAVYVPWLICMDTNGDPATQCDDASNVDTTAVESCVSNIQGYTNADLNLNNVDLLQQFLDTDSPIGGTPTCFVDYGAGAGDETVRSSFYWINKKLCAADPPPAACSTEDLRGADEEIPMERRPDGEIVA